MNNRDKKVKLLENENAKVIICNTPEAKMFAELIPNIDKAYRYLRNNVGSEKVGLDYFDEKRKDILYFMEKINDFVQIVFIFVSNISSLCETIFSQFKTKTG